MLEDPAILFAAVESRDPRFDGRFFSAITTTGVYCRPVCPARTPKRHNIRFFPSAAAAEIAGFRACLRCRPETAPGGAAWIGTAATVRRAVRLIEDGALNHAGVDTLASRLGVGGRHLRRLFQEHLGASPTAIAKSCRLATTRLLLQKTTLPVHEVAAQAGFGSVRRFNDVVLATFGRTPTELRRQGSSATLQLHLAYRPPLAWGALLGFLEKRAAARVERVDGGSWCRTVQTPGGYGVLRVRPSVGRPTLEVTMPATFASEIPSIVRRLRRQFDLDADPLAIYSVLRNDDRLRPLLDAHPGLRIPGSFDGLSLCIRAVLGQRISVVAASTLFDRVIERWGASVSTDVDGLDRLFPTADALSTARFEDVGVMGAASATLRNLACLARDGDLDLAPRESLDSWVEKLCELRGIGPWTAHYIALRAGGEPDAFPSADLGLRRATRQQPVSASELEVEAESWRPWRGYAAIALWSVS